MKKSPMEPKIAFGIQTANTTGKVWFLAKPSNAI